MKIAILEVNSCKKCATVAARHEIPRQTLQKKVKMYLKDTDRDLSSQCGKTEFSFKQEKIMANVFQIYESA